MSIVGANAIRKRSPWWWCQKVGTAVVCTALLVWLGAFILAATETVAITRLDLSTDERLESSLQPLTHALGSENDKFEAGVLTVSLEVNREVEVRAEVRPSIEELSSQTTNRIHWRAFRCGDDGIWRLARDYQALPGGSCTVSFVAREPGRYLVVVAAAPVDLDRLDQRTTHYISNMLLSSAASRCRAMQFLVNASDSSAKMQGGLSSSGRPSTGLAPVDGESDQLSHTDPAISGDNSDSAGRDLSTAQEGVESSRGQSTKADREEKRATSHEVEALVQDIPPRKGRSPATFEDTKRMRADGSLPEVEVLYRPDELASLTVDEWVAICKTSQMPFLVVPKDEYQQEIPQWPVVLPDGTRRRMAPDEIRKAYGFQLLPLGDFSSDIQRYAKESIGDPLLLFKCDSQRGFLLSDVLLKAISEAMAKENIPADQVQRVKKIVVAVMIKEGNENGRRIVLEARQLERHRE